MSGNTHYYFKGCNLWTSFIEYKTAAHHMVLQSKLTRRNLLGFVLKDMAYSMPDIRYLNSGQMNELPAYAASTCNHSLKIRENFRGILELVS